MILKVWRHHSGASMNALVWPQTLPVLSSSEFQTSLLYAAQWASCNVRVNQLAYGGVTGWCTFKRDSHLNHSVLTLSAASWSLSISYYYPAHDMLSLASKGYQSRLVAVVTSTCSVCIVTCDWDPAGTHP